ncbi:hypothetical protein KPH14_006439 [Odynerus spinipes]|uniref:Uncharacterized protein n=1 Tax=Odynerus spinipes TaxID=1348599 RepID=A0AAD9RQL6_9HYME|nr:hypothetical protein KPH14_006439 [Odynerus spinipes]
MEYERLRWALLEKETDLGDTDMDSYMVSQLHNRTDTKPQLDLRKCNRIYELLPLLDESICGSWTLLRY